MINMINLYISFSKVNFLTQLEYRMQYFMRMFSKLIFWVSGFIMIYVLLHKFKTIVYWNKYEILFLYSLNVLSYSIAATFLMNPFGNLSRNIQLGMFDEVLTKPVNTLFYYVCTKTSAGYTSNIFITFIVILVCFVNLKIELNFFKIIMFIFVLLGSVLIQASAFIITSLPAFWIVKSENLMNLFFLNLTKFLQYPLPIYSKFIQIFLTFILPYAFINYYPSILFLSKKDYIFHPFFQYITPIIGIIFFTVAYLGWKIAINNYKSTGS